MECLPSSHTHTHTTPHPRWWTEGMECLHSRYIDCIWKRLKKLLTAINCHWARGHGSMEFSSEFGTYVFQKKKINSFWKHQTSKLSIVLRERNKEEITRSTPNAPIMGIWISRDQVTSQGTHWWQNWDQLPSMYSFWMFEIFNKNTLKKKKKVSFFIVSLLKQKILFPQKINYVWENFNIL